MKTKKTIKKSILFLVILLMFVFTLYGCTAAEDRDDERDDDGVEDRENGEQGDEEREDNGEDEDTPPEEPDYQEQLLNLFPNEEGFEWIYSGFLEYGHVMHIDSIEEEENTGNIIYNITGEIDDVSAGEAPGDYDLELQYIFTRNSVIEKIVKGEKFPHKLGELVILKYPLEEGAQWEQEVDIEGEKRQLKAVIQEIGEDEAGKTYYIVVYEVEMGGMPDNTYREIRYFKEVVGLERFENTLEEELGFEENFIYVLYMTTSPND